MASLVHPENTRIIKTGNGFEADSNCDEHIENCHFHVHVGPKRRSSEIVASRVFLKFHFVFSRFFVFPVPFLGPFFDLRRRFIFATVLHIRDLRPRFQAHFLGLFSARTFQIILSKKRA